MKIKTFQLVYLPSYKRQQFNLIMLIVLLFSGISCTDFVAPNIEDSKLTLLVPTDSMSIKGSTVTFKWQKVEFAESYTIQLVANDFSKPTKWLLDSSLTKTSLTLNLLPDNYSWRVCAQNFSYSTAFTTATFSIIDIPDISNETIIMIYPPSKDTNNHRKIAFHWAKLPNADSYRFLLSREGQVIVDMETTTDTITLPLQYGDGDYEWKVRGQNTYYNTAYSSRNFYCDTTPPSIPVLKSPTNHQLISDTLVNLIWTNPLLAGSTVYDSILVATDSLFRTKVLNTYINGEEIQILLESGHYFWKVRAIDKAGNLSNFSQPYKFTISY